MKTGTDLIAAERQRQMDAEGWTPEHDDEHVSEELALAAAAYATPNDYRESRTPGCAPTYGSGPWYWPWSREWWKPSPDDRVRELVKAGALIAAEIDRLLRKEPSDG